MLSQVFDSGFNPYLRKMNLIRGMDILQDVGHNHRNFGSITGTQHPGPHVSTIDQVIARAPGFYPAGFAGVRSLHLAPLWGFTRASSFVAADGRRQDLDITFDPRIAFQQLFGSQMGTTPSASTSLVNLVIEDYRRLRNNSRLSSVDRSRLDQHIGALADLQAAVAQPMSCTTPTSPPSVSHLNPSQSFGDGINRAAIMNDVVVAGLRCGLTKVAVLSTGGIYPGFTGGDLHQDLWHRWESGNSTIDSQIAGAVNWYFRSVLLDMIRKMDAVVESNGRTLLDNSLVVVVAENQAPHDDLGKSFVTFGSGGGRFTTGKYLDYRNRQSPIAVKLRRGHATFAGLPTQPFFNSILQGFGLTPQQYERPRTGIYQYGGYGAIYNTGNWTSDHSLRKDAGGRDYRSLPETRILSEYWIGQGLISLVDQKLPHFSLT